MPWDLILGAGGVSAVLVSLVIVLMGNVLLKALETRVDNNRIRLESEIRRVEEQVKNTLTLTSQIDLDLREKRLTVYKDLWQMTGILTLWPRTQGVTYGKLQEFSLSLQNWYFTQGGMFLSESSRDAYGKVQEGIEKLADQAAQTELSADHYDDVRELCSKLRSELVSDIESRRQSPI